MPSRGSHDRRETGIRAGEPRCGARAGVARGAHSPSLGGSPNNEEGARAFRLSRRSWPRAQSRTGRNEKAEPARSLEVGRKHLAMVVEPRAPHLVRPLVLGERERQLRAKPKVDSLELLQGVDQLFRAERGTRALERLDEGRTDDETLERHE